MTDEELIPVFIPSLGALLLIREDKKGSPLTREEVMAIRDEAVVVMLPRSVAEKMTEERGYEDLDPENV